MSGFSVRRAAAVAAVAAAVVVHEAEAGTVNPLSVDVSTCTNLPTAAAVPTTLEGFAAASSIVVDALPTFVSYENSCGYYSCFEVVMNSWSSWEFGAAATNLPAPGFNATTTASSSQPSSTSSASSLSRLPSESHPSLSRPAPSSSRPTASSAPSSSTSPATTAAAHLAARARPHLAQFPLSSAVSECCGECVIWAGNAQILYWPGTTSAPPPDAYSTAVHDRTTLTSPTLYFAITGPFAINQCGSLTTGPSAAIIPAPSAGLRRILYPITGPKPLYDQLHTSLNPAELSGCATATSGEYTITETISGTVVTGDRCFPVLEIPTEVVAFEAGWKDCVPAIYGVDDPPRPLTVETFGPPPVPSTTPPAAPTHSPPPPSSPPAQSSSPAVQQQQEPTAKSQQQQQEPTPQSQQQQQPEPTPQSQQQQQPEPTPQSQQQQQQEPTPQSQQQQQQQQQPPAPTPTVVHIASQAFTLGAVTSTDHEGATHTVLGLIMPDTTLLAGNSALTVSGTAISLGSSALMVGSVTTSVDAVPAATSVDVGNVIMGALGGTVPAAGPEALVSATVSINEASPTGANGGTGAPTILEGLASRDRPLQACFAAAVLVLAGAVLL